MVKLRKWPEAHRRVLQDHAIIAALGRFAQLGKAGKAGKCGVACCRGVVIFIFRFLSKSRTRFNRKMHQDLNRYEIGIRKFQFKQR